MADHRVNVAGKSIEDLLSDGNRAYSIRNFTNAVAHLSRCAELAGFKYGEQHEKLGPIYYSYGRALLELSREDVDPLGEAVPKDIALEAIEEDIGDEEEEENAEGEKKEEEDDEEGDSTDGEDDKKQDKPEEANSNEEKDIEGTSKGIEFNGEITDDQDKDVSREETKDNAEEGSSGEKKEETEAKEEEPTDLQVAWEVLELAKIIFKNKGDAGKEQLSNTLILLGEVSLESENFESAINDIKEGLEIQTTIFEKENRKLAETYYKLGVALSTNNQMDEAIENFKRTIEHLNYRIAMLEVTDDVDLDKDEITEMKQLIPEVEEKIADMKLCKEEKAKAEVADPEIAIQPSPEKKATDISHLVKRKRNLNDSSEGCCSSPAKKPATES